MHPDRIRVLPQAVLIEPAEIDVVWLAVPSFVPVGERPRYDDLGRVFRLTAW